MARDVLNTDLLGLIINTNYFASPQIGDLDLLTSSWNDSKITKSELKLTMHNFSPVYDDCNSVSTTYCGRIHLGVSHQSGPSVTT
jgi:hypothetical protein